MSNKRSKKYHGGGVPRHVYPITWRYRAPRRITADLAGVAFMFTMTIVSVFVVLHAFHLPTLWIVR